MYIPPPGPRTATDIQLEHRLAEWYEWRAPVLFDVGRGYRGSSLGGGTSTASHWDSRTGVADELLDLDRVRGVGRAMKKIESAEKQSGVPWHRCLEQEAMNIANQSNLWENPLLPTGEELEILRIESRTMLLRVFRLEGVLS